MCEDSVMWWYRLRLNQRQSCTDCEHYESYRQNLACWR